MLQVFHSRLYSTPPPVQFLPLFSKQNIDLEPLAPPWYSATQTVNADSKII